ncbi:MAG: gamma-glutamylcyclotransferase [Abditibacteriota bacterium]|nr:gamma-glutamylcyclotransferase [Abditibacteriota bacterium]
MMTIYAAYGSNMNEEQMKKRCPQSELMGIGYLKDYKLKFLKYANIVPSVGDNIPVMLWKINDSDEKELDGHEGVNETEKISHYVKRYLSVEFEEQIIDNVLVYIMNEEKKKRIYLIKEYIPSTEYFYRIYSGYEKFNLSCEPLFKALFETWQRIYVGKESSMETKVVSPEFFPLIYDFIKDNRFGFEDSYLLYVAYGSNLVIEEMKDRCPKSFPLTKGIIKDYKLAFNIHADIRECEGSYVPVGLWAINKDDLDRLDYYEGYPSYYNKKIVKVCVGEKEVEALVYYMTDRKTEKEPYPSYMNRIKQGYKDFGIS